MPQDGQLPPVTGAPIFRSPVWRLFYPLILSTSHRQSNDTGFFSILEELRFGTLSVETIQLLIRKHQEYTAASSTLTTTHICSYRRHADHINDLITSTLPEAASYENLAVDLIDNEPVSLDTSSRSFKHYTNLPDRLIIAIGARVMFLNNSLFQHGICNGSIGVILAYNDDDSIKVAFPTLNGIHEIDVHKTSVKFDVDGSPAIRHQFPLQNTFALTVHKTQDLTLPAVCLELDETMFACGQAYVAISRAKRWEDITISSFTPHAFRVDKNVITEYNRLRQISDIYHWSPQTV